MRPYRRAFTGLAVVPLLALAACGGGASAGEGSDAGALRLGYFANVTHAAALVGIQDGLLAAELGDVDLQLQVFDSGPTAVEALFAGALDAAYIGPNPAINAFGESEGEAIRIIAGATSGGAQLVVREGITSAEDLRGTTVATPSLGNTQDVALRAWLAEEGLATSVEGGGDVSIAPTRNGDTLQLFRDGQLDGAWLPEPWASRLVLEAGATVLLDEAELWPGGQFVTTHLIVRTEFLEEQPEAVEALLRGHVAAVEQITADAEAAKVTVNAGIEEATSEPLPTEVLDRAWEALEVTVDPIASSLQESADDAVAAGVVDDPVELDGIYDLRLLNAVLAEQDLTPVSAGGLGQE